MLGLPPLELRDFGSFLSGSSKPFYNYNKLFLEKEVGDKERFWLVTEQALMVPIITK